MPEPEYDNYERKPKYDTSSYRNLPGLLPDHLIRELISIEPFSEGIKREGIISYGLTSTGYDFRLGRKFKVFTNIHGAIIDPKNINEKVFHTIEDADFCIIPPNSYILGESVEYLKIPRDISCLCVGKSTYARCGIIVNVTPGEPEWEGRWTIEISNSSPVPAKVYAEEGIMQVLFFRSVTECNTSYADKKGKYQFATGLQNAQVDQAQPEEELIKTRKCSYCRGLGYIKGEGPAIKCSSCHGKGRVNEVLSEEYDPRNYE